MDMNNEWEKEFDEKKKQWIQYGGFCYQDGEYSIDHIKKYISTILTTTAQRVREETIEEVRENTVDIIERLKIDERNTREYLTGNGEGWVAESYADKQLVNAVYFHLQSVIRDHPLSTLNK